MPKKPVDDPKAVAADVADELLRRLPALRDLESLIQAVAAVRATPTSITFDLDEPLPLEAIERAYVLHVLAECGGSRSRAAEVLHIDVSTLYRKLSRWGEG